MRILSLYLSLLLAAPAAAQTPIADLFAAKGLAGTIAELETRTDPDHPTQFALGAAHFLRGVEKSLQLRYRTGLTGSTMNMPVLRLPIDSNPTPEPFQPEMILQLFTDIGRDMDASRQVLSQIAGDADFHLTVPLQSLWFDINGDATRGPGEGVMEMAGPLLVGNRRTAFQPAEQVTFDRADAAWLLAYTHFLSAFSELAQAFPPTEAIDTVLRSSKEMRSFMELAPPVNAFDHLFAEDVDLATMLYFALQQQPDPKHTRAIRDHLLAMIRQNRAFWRLVELETDNSAEWVPNARQTSAMGIAMAEDMAETWQTILTDAEHLLTGTTLIPHWRLGAKAGINLAKLLETPIPVEPVGWLQGSALLPYAEQGERANLASWRQFERMVRGDALLFVMFLN